jgi:RNA polymerase-binding transcription factor
VAVKKKKAVKKKVKKKTTSTKKKSSASKKRAPAKKASKSTKKKSKSVAKKAVKKAKAKKPKASAKKSPVKKAAAKVVSKKAAPKKAAPKKIVPKKKVPKKASAKKVVEPPEEIIKPFVKSPFKKDDPKILKIQERLNHDRKRLMGMLRSSKEVERTINDITFSNEIDLASSLEGREMAFQLSSRERNELRMVEEALFKIKGDTYGVCDNCSKYITLKRLEILPLTALCIACQENLEVR